MRTPGSAASITSTRQNRTYPTAYALQERVAPVIVLQPQAYALPSSGHVAHSTSCRGSTCPLVTHATSHASSTPLTAVAALGHNASINDRNAWARVAQLSTLARSWAKVSKRLPQDPANGSSSEAVRKIISALRLSLSWLEGGNGAPRRADGRTPFERAVQLAVILAELSAAGLPLDADSIAAGVLSEAADSSYLDHDTIRAKMGDDVATLVHDIMRIRTVPARVEVFEDSAASAMREWCIAFNDIRANVVEVVCCLDQLRHMGPLPLYEQQQLALEALQVYAPLGHALGLGAISAAMEDISFQVLFPESYAHTSQWLHTVADPAEQALYAAQQQLLRALDAHPRFNQLASGCVLRARTKSLFSMMKKLLRLGDMAKGGRKPGEIFDVLGMRAVVQPRSDLPAEQAEQAAVQACYIVEEVACSLWHVVPKRTKDYIRHPKANGYRSIHLTICLQSVMQEMARHAQHTQQGDSPAVSAGDLNSKSCVATAAQPWSSLDAEEKLQQLAQRAGHTLSTARSVSVSSLSSQDSQDELGNVEAFQQSDSAGSKEACPSAVAAPYMELQIRTQSMDDRAESGEAAHAAYKGGLDTRQARQLQAWSSELQQRLAFKPQGKLLLPPSVVAELDQSISVMDSVDLDLDYIPFDLGAQPSAVHPASLPQPPNSPMGYHICGGSSGVGAGRGANAGVSRDGGVAQGRDGPSEVLIAEEVLQPSQGAGSADMMLADLQPQASLQGQQQGGTEQSQQQDNRSSLQGALPVSAAAASLFKFIDSNGDGRVSLSELREQLAELTGGVPSPFSATSASSGPSRNTMLPAGAFTPAQLSYPPELLSFIQQGWGTQLPNVSLGSSHMPDPTFSLGSSHLEDPTYSLTSTSLDIVAWLDSPFGGICLDSPTGGYSMLSGARDTQACDWTLQGRQLHAIPGTPSFMSMASAGSQDEEGRGTSLLQGSYSARLQSQQDHFVLDKHDKQFHDSCSREGSGEDGSVHVSGGGKGGSEGGEGASRAAGREEGKGKGLECVVRALSTEPEQLHAEDDEGMSLDEFAAFLQQAGDLRRRLSNQQQQQQQRLQ